jgi:hypothetical protein
MYGIYKVIAVVHALAGTAGLVAFWIPAFAKKGGRLHRRVGWFYTGAMGLSVSLAVLLVGMMLAMPQTVVPELSPTGVRRFAAFLAVLPLLVFTGVWHGIGSVRGFAAGPIARWSNRALFAVGAVELALALIWRSPLHGIFGGIAIVSAVGNLRWPEGPVLKAQRIIGHLGGMIATGIAAHTAFLVFGLPRAFPGLNAGTLGLAVWVLPGVVGVTAANLIARRYRPAPVK